MKIGKTFKIILIVIGVIIIIAIGLAGWAYLDVTKYKDLEIKDVDLQNIADGTYEGNFKGGRFSNFLMVTVKYNKIVDIKALKSSAPQEELYRKIYAKVIEKQSLQIDTVSGATVTTLTTLKAIENALSK
ncbi:FMN-binding protein [Candidatus Poribacteria bacterium]|nr:FMN-binding protein [Candidatus Poribacteria bacterium]